MPNSATQRPTVGRCCFIGMRLAIDGPVFPRYTVIEEQPTGVLLLAGVPFLNGVPPATTWSNCGMEQPGS